LEVNLPFVRCLIVVHKTSSDIAPPDENPTSYYLSSRLPGPAESFAKHIRGHWRGSEIRNHWVRDALWGEDQTRSKNWNLNANLAILRAGLVALIACREIKLSWPALFELVAFQPSYAFGLITHSPSK
jgi:predicted transposase YbfD/YdcC